MKIIAEVLCVMGKTKPGLASKAILCVIRITSTGNTKMPPSYRETAFNRSTINSLPTMARLGLGNVKGYLRKPIANKNKRYLMIIAADIYTLWRLKNFNLICKNQVFIWLDTFNIGRLFNYS